MKPSVIALASITLLTVFGFAEKPQPSLPEELTKLREQWINDKQKAIAPINRKYAENLNALMRKFTKNGQLEAALAVDAELKSLEYDQPNPFVGEWIQAGFKDVSRPIIIRQDHTATDLGNGNQGTWQIQQGNLLLRWKTGWVARMALNQASKPVASITMISPDGKEENIQIRRIK